MGYKHERQKECKQRITVYKLLVSGHSSAVLPSAVRARRTPMTNAAPTVLVVDDNEIKRYTTRRTLEAAGLVVAEAATGEEALDFVNTVATRPHVVVMSAHQRE